MAPACSMRKTKLPGGMYCDGLGNVWKGNTVFCLSYIMGLYCIFPPQYNWKPATLPQSNNLLQWQWHLSVGQCNLPCGMA